MIILGSGTNTTESGPVPRPNVARGRVLFFVHQFTPVKLNDSRFCTRYFS